MKSEPDERHIIVTPTERLALEAAERIAEAVDETLQHKQIFRMVLAGGNTPKKLYQCLAEDPFRSVIPWRRIHFFWGDERCVPPDHPESNYRMVREALLDRLPVPDANIHRMKGEDADPPQAARSYEAELRRHFGQEAGQGPPKFDLILLGLGTDGHTASLFPDTPALQERRRWVVANPVAKLKAQRLTLSLAVLNRAARVFFLVSGADKATILSQILERSPEGLRLPAALIRPADGPPLWLVDDDAASRLRPSQTGERL